MGGADRRDLRGSGTHRDVGIPRSGGPCWPDCVAGGLILVAVFSTALIAVLADQRGLTRLARLLALVTAYVLAVGLSWS